MFISTSRHQAQIYYGRLTALAFLYFKLATQVRDLQLSVVEKIREETASEPAAKDPAPKRS